MAAVRAREEVAIAEALKERTAQLEKEYAETRKRLDAGFLVGKAGAEHELQEQRKQLLTRFEEEQRQITQDYSRAQQYAETQFQGAREQNEADYKESRWTISTMYDADKKVARERLAQAKQRAKSSLDKAVNWHQEGVQLLKGWDFRELLQSPPEPPPPASTEPWQALQHALTLASERLTQLQSLRTPRYLVGWRLPLILIVAWLGACAPAVLLREYWYFWLAGATVGTLIAGWFLRSWLARHARRQADHLFQELQLAVVGARLQARRCREAARTDYHAERTAAKEKYNVSLAKVVAQARQSLQELTQKRDHTLELAQSKYPPQLDDLANRRKGKLAQIEEKHQQNLADLTFRRDQDYQLCTERFEKGRGELNRWHAQEWTRLVTTWKSGCDRFRTVVQEIDQDCQKLFPSWESPALADWKPATSYPPGIRFGRLEVTPARIPHGVPEDPHLPPLDLGNLSFPALLPFPARSSLMFKTDEFGRDEAVQALQAIMLRLLTAVPPSKVRFTILDPIGRGEHFAAFMHLADHDELLITSRIWTEQNHIEHRLADLTAHMENVIQKYLRNQFETLEDYNAQAGEVAEPFRILVVAGFPVNFSSEAARRLVSLAASGARCGIYPLILHDSRHALPHDFQLADLEKACLNLIWREGKFTWKDPDFGPFPLTLDQPPEAETCTRILQAVGEQAKIAGRVEVPFDMVALPPDQWWTADSRNGISVPLGRAGALAKQFLQLGQGTAQHALIGGKTGSGKSTLLHALITQLALNYSPDEVELYLIDFKKGVEFKTYAVNELPHARVVAVESEREFGLSVLQRLDVELRLRGEKFRQLGISDLPGYRQLKDAGSNGQLPPMPRVLLIVDEFQEFFVEDDKIAQEAALLFDRLVRQGRAFGIHILLGSQTLGGAFSLARSTLDQMGVRIALQCSEADAHLILSKENSAARLLTRPGEAIYNAAGGLLEGNNLFQVVWLSDDRRDASLRSVHALARERHVNVPRPIVFEGTAPSDLPKNLLLQKLFDSSPPSASAAVPTAWLGEAIAIKDPTAAAFRRQTGANLLMVGQQGDIAFNLMVAGIVGLSAQCPPRNGNGNGIAPFYLIAGASLEHDGEAFLTRLPELLPVQAIAPRDLAGLLQTLSEELDRRQKGATGDPVFLLLHGLHRLRDLRKGEDDFGFNRKEEKVSPAKQFATLLREGPNHGIHTIAWCDGLPNLQRTLDRQGLREFELRVLFQMSAADSSNLIDNPAASRLGMHRALYYTEDQGKTEKFRPYGLPPLGWLEEVKAKRNGLVGSPG